MGWDVFSRHGGNVVFLERFVSLFRTYAAFLAGGNRMRWRRFTAFNVAGGVLWSATYTAGAYKTGRLIARAPTAFSVAAAVTGMIVTVVLVRNGTATLTDRAEAAFPDLLETSDPTDSRSAGPDLP